MDVGVVQRGWKTRSLGAKMRIQSFCSQVGWHRVSTAWWLLWQPVTARSLPHACLSTTLTADPSNMARPAGRAIPCLLSDVSDSWQDTWDTTGRGHLPVQTSGFTAAKEKPADEMEQEGEGTHSSFCYCCKRYMLKFKFKPLITRSLYFF